MPLGDKYIYHRLKVPLQFHMKCFFSEELEMDRSILFQHLHIGLCLDDLTHFKMMHSFQRFSFCRLLDGIQPGFQKWQGQSTVHPGGAGGRALLLAVVAHLVPLCAANPSAEKTVSWFDWLVSSPDRPSAAGPTCFHWQALLLCAHH